MARKVPKPTVIKALFARSGNKCAFPGCTQRLVNDKNQFIGQLCHIEAANLGGERYNDSQSDEYRRSYENLILLCYPHHIETNDVLEFPSEQLSSMKWRHEQNCQGQPFHVNDEFVSQLTKEMDSYWGQIEVINTIEHLVPKLALEINAKASFFEIIADMKGLVNKIEKTGEYFEESDQLLMTDLLGLLKKAGIDSKGLQSVPYYENPFVNRNWEMRNLGFRNTIAKLHINLLHTEIKFLEEYLKINPTDTDGLRRLEELKETFRQVARTAGYAD